MQVLLRTIPVLSLVACVDDPGVDVATSELGCTTRKLEAFSSEHDEGRLVFSPDGTLALFHRTIAGNLVIMESHRTASGWTPPAVAGFSGTWPEFDAYIAWDGRTVFFTSFRPVPGETAPRGDGDIWKVTRTATGWSEPVYVTDVNTTSQEFFPSTTLDGTLYFNSERPGSQAWDLYAAKPRHGGGYQTPLPLAGDVNSDIWEFNPSPGPFGRLLAFASLDPDPAAPFSDVFLSVKRGGAWSERIDAGACVNTELEEYHPTLDVLRGRLLFVRNDPSAPQGDFYEARLSLSE